MLLMQLLLFKFLWQEALRNVSSTAPGQRNSWWWHSTRITGFRASQVLNPMTAGCILALAPVLDICYFCVNSRSHVGYTVFHPEHA